MRPNKKQIFYIVIISILLLSTLVLYSYRVQFERIITPFFLAIIISYLLHPIVIKLESRDIPRSVSILSIYALFFVATVSAVVFIVPELINNTKELMGTLPDITSQYQNYFNKFMSIIQSSQWPHDIKHTIFEEVQNNTLLLQNSALDTLRHSLSKMIDNITLVFDFFLGMVIAYYFIKDADFFKTSALSLTPRKWRNGLVNTGREVSQVISSFVQGQLLTAVIIGILETIGLYLIGMKYPLILGLIGGIANIIPYFGPIIGAIPAVAIALIDSPLKALWVIVVFIIIQQIDNAFVSPKIIEGKLGLHPVSTILAVLIGGEFFGILGMLLSVPVMAILKVLVRRSVEAIV